VIENEKNRETNFFYTNPSNRWFRNGIHRLQRRTDAIGSADIIYRMWRISQLCGLGITSLHLTYSDFLNMFSTLFSRCEVHDRRQRFTWRLCSHCTCRIRMCHPCKY